MQNNLPPIFLGLGSNIGQREENIKKALDYLDNHPFISVKDKSSFIETKAVVKVSQPDFINAVCKISTILSPIELLYETQQVEKKLGRKEKGNQEPRTIDIDILFYGNRVITQENLTIPHALVHTRMFTLGPLNEIAPNFIHPLLNQSISTLLENIATEL